MRLCIRPLWLKVRTSRANNVDAVEEQGFNSMAQAGRLATPNYHVTTIAVEQVNGPIWPKRWEPAACLIQASYIHVGPPNEGHVTRCLRKVNSGIFDGKIVDIVTGECARLVARKD